MYYINDFNENVEFQPFFGVLLKLLKRIVRIIKKEDF